MQTDRRTLNLARIALNIAAAFIAVVGVIFHVDQMYLMAATLFLLPRASWLVGRVMQDGVTGTRRLPALCGVGETVPVTSDTHQPGAAAQDVSAGGGPAAAPAAFWSGNAPRCSCVSGPARRAR